MVAFDGFTANGKRDHRGDTEKEDRREENGEKVNNQKDDDKESDE